jgi:hypothetical protein
MTDDILDFYMPKDLASLPLDRLYDLRGRLMGCWRRAIQRGHWGLSESLDLKISTVESLIQKKAEYNHSKKEE